MIQYDIESLRSLVEYSNTSFYKEIEEDKKYFYREKTNSEKWFELIYSVLVGSQIKTDKVRFCYKKLLQTCYLILEPKFLVNIRFYDSIKSKIYNSLRESGYRFTESKTETIYNCILFFSKWKFNIDLFIKRFKDVDKIRKELTKIRGIGLKIASHWLRNIGFYLPVIDLHLKRFIDQFSVKNVNSKNYLNYESIQNNIIEILKIDNITFDLALWYFGKEFCGKKKCSNCIFANQCSNIRI